MVINLVTKRQMFCEDDDLHHKGKLIFILMLYTGVLPNFHPNTIHYRFWPNFHRNPIP